jgi:hypothetical protein
MGPGRDVTGRESSLFVGMAVTYGHQGSRTHERNAR